MPEQVIDLPDSKKLVVFETNQHPDFTGTSINIQETLRADIPTYLIVGDNITPANNTNLLSIFNNISTGKRIRIQRISAYPRTTANNQPVLQIAYINSSPTGGTDATFSRFAADFPDNETAPNGVISKVLPSSPNPIAGINLGGNIVNLTNGAGLRKFDLFSVTGNGSALQLRAGQDGITIRQVAGSNTGTLTLEVLFTLD